MEIGSSIKIIRDKLGLSQEDFGKRIGITRSSVSLLESGKNKPSDQTVLLICKVFDVSEVWLRTGTGEMFATENNDAIDAMIQRYDLDHASAAILRIYAELPQSYRDVLRDVTLRMAAALPAESEQEKAERLISEHLLSPQEKQA